MSKSNRIYKIFMTTMIVAIAGMLLAMGIIAAQKTMKLGVQFSSNPNYKLEVFINDEETLIFRNFADTSGKTVKMDNGITSLNGDTLLADEEAFKSYGNDFTIIIKNYTESTGIEVSMESTAKIDGGADGIPAQIQEIKAKAIKYDPDTKIADSVSFRIYINSVFPQTTTLKMTISELSDVSITYTATNNCSLSSSPETAAIGSTYETTITAETGYIFDETSVTVAGNSYTWQVDTNDKTKGTLTIANVQSDFTINANARYPRLKVIYEGEGASADGLSARNPTYGYEMKVVAKNFSVGYGNFGYPAWDGNGDLAAQPSNGYEIPYSVDFAIFTTVYQAGASYFYYSFSYTQTEGPGITGTQVANGGYRFTMPRDDIEIQCSNLTYHEYASCFPAGTQVYTETGYKNIEDIQNGDMVWSYNESTQEFELKEVYNTYVRHSYTEIITIGIGDTEITATYNHRFLTQNRGWITIKEITPDDWLIAGDGVYQITSYKSEMKTDYFYNLNVQDNHNYLVSDKNIVVHNAY